MLCFVYYNQQAHIHSGSNKYYLKECYEDLSGDSKEAGFIELSVVGCNTAVATHKAVCIALHRTMTFCKYVSFRAYYYYYYYYYGFAVRVSAVAQVEYDALGL